MFLFYLFVYSKLNCFVFFRCSLARKKANQSVLRFFSNKLLTITRKFLTVSLASFCRCTYVRLIFKFPYQGILQIFHKKDNINYIWIFDLTSLAFFTSNLGGVTGDT